MLYSKDDTIGGYEVKFPITRSDYAESYRVKDRANRTRCLKLFHDEACGEQAIARARALRQHANLCRALNWGTDSAGHRFLVTDYISGESLTKRLGRGESLTTVAMVKSVALAVLSALHHIHANGMVHGRVNPDNILLSLTDGLDALKLIGGLVDKSAPMTPDTILYAAPEVIEGGRATAAADIFAVGAVIYRMIYGRAPWSTDLEGLSGEKLIGTALRSRSRTLVLPVSERNGIDEQMVNIMAKALQAAPDDRFATASEMIDALAGIITVEPQATRRCVLSADEGGGGGTGISATRPTGSGLDAVAGMDELKKMLREEVIEPLQNPEEYRRYGVTIPNGMLLYGPPGCGKTFFAKHLAEEIGFTFMPVTPASLKSRYVNATQENIAQMFRDACDQAPTIIFIDELNELTPSRQSDIHEMSRSAVNEMLAQMDRTGEKEVFVIGATNFPDMIDPAIMRSGRLDRKYYVAPPDKEGRMALIKMYLAGRPVADDIDLEKLAELTEGYVSSDIYLIINDAARSAMRASALIDMAALTSTIAAAKPSLSAGELHRYEEVHRAMEGGDATSARPRVGFL